MPALSFKFRILLTFTGITLILVILMSRIGYVTMRGLYLDQTRDQTALLMKSLTSRMDAKNLAFLNLSGGASLGADYYREFLRSEQKVLGFEKLTLANLELISLVSTDTELEGSIDPEFLLNKSGIDSLAVSGLITTEPFRASDGQWYLWSFYKIDDRLLLCARQSAARFENLEEISTVFWGIGGIGVTLTVVGAFLLVRTLTRPIDRMVQFSRELGCGNWDTTAPQDVKSELQTLVHAMDVMRQGLRARHEEKEQLLAQIAHEIRNPLGSLELMTGLVREDLVKNRLDTRHTEIMIREIASLKVLITQYLDYGRPVKPKPESVNIRILTGEILQLQSEVLGAKQISVSENGDDVVIEFDPYHLRQILTNLISNAEQALAVGGTICISRYRRNGCVTIGVTDNGPGIPENVRTKVFEPFVTTRPDGTGLGLAICRKLCRENNARIELVTSTPGQTTFQIEKDL